MNPPGQVFGDQKMASVSAIEEAMALREAQFDTSNVAGAPTIVISTPSKIESPAQGTDVKPAEEVMSADDWMDIIEGKPSAPPEKVEPPKPPPPVEPVESEVMSADDLMDIIEGRSTAPPAKMETPARESDASSEVQTLPPTPDFKETKEEEVFSPDDWMDMMEGKEATGAAVADVVTSQGLAYSLKQAPDYTVKHDLPERQEFKMKEMTPSRDGLKKKSIFYQTKVAFKARLGGSTKNPGKLCASCGKGKKANQCIYCSADDAAIMTRVCEECLANKKTANNCISCGRPGAKVIARVCDKCRARTAFCAKCGKSFR